MSINEMNKKISVIIPVYNAELYIEKCIKSVINQKYKNLEIIIIDDGSNDNSLSICRKYEKEDRRIKLITQQNAGVSQARKRGIELATGDYLTFIDADDYIKEDMYIDMFNTIILNDADIVECGYRVVDDQCNILNKRILRREIIEGLDNCLEKYLNSENTEVFLWNKLYRAKLFENLSLEEYSYSEDYLWNIKLFSYCKKKVTLNKCYYNYLNNYNGACNKKFNIKKLDGIYAALDGKKYLEINNKKFSKYCIKYIMQYCLSIYKEFYCDKKNNGVILNQITTIYNNYYNLEAVKDISSFTNKVAFLLFKFSPVLYMYFDKIYEKFKKEQKELQISKNVGIVTILDISNLGNRLQNYALEYYIKFYCKNTYTLILYKTELEMTLKIIRHLIGNFLKKAIYYKYSRYNYFMRFQKLISTDNILIDSINKKYDFLIVGSDQVWNPSFGRLSNIDTLTMINDKKRISYAASFGINNLKTKDKEIVKREISKFKAISVRENRGKEIIEELTDRTDVEVLIDPTMLLNSEEWDKVSKIPKQINKLNGKKYILNYFLGNLSKQRKIEIERIAKENACEIINILDENDPFFVSGPSEFLYLEKNAFLICTDSFHSSVFAILYNRPFVIFDREQEGVEKMNSRIDTLISKFNLKNRKYNGSKITKENLEHDYTEAYKILEEERKKSDAFLKKALDIKESE